MVKITSEQKRAFTLIELLTAISVMVLVMSLSGPALRSLCGERSANKAIADLSGSLELARTYAMTNHTYVRVGFCEVSSISRLTPSTVVISVYSADGSEATSMTSVNWPYLSKPLILDNFVPVDKNGASPDTSSDANPFSSPSSFGSLSLPVSNMGSISFASFVEFTPAGEARLGPGQMVRYIKIAIDRPSANQSDPFILRLSGINGTIATLRKENL